MTGRIAVTIVDLGRNLDILPQHGSRENGFKYIRCGTSYTKENAAQ